MNLPCKAFWLFRLFVAFFLLNAGIGNAQFPEFYVAESPSEGRQTFRYPTPWDGPRSPDVYSPHQTIVDPNSSPYSYCNGTYGGCVFLADHGIEKIVDEVLNKTITQREELRRRLANDLAMFDKIDESNPALQPLSQRRTQEQAQLELFRQQLKSRISNLESEEEKAALRRSLAETAPEVWTREPALVFSNSSMPMLTELGSWMSFGVGKLDSGIPGVEFIPLQDGTAITVTQNILRITPFVNDAADWSEVVSKRSAVYPYEELSNTQWACSAMSIVFGNRFVWEQAFKRGYKLVQILDEIVKPDDLKYLKEVKDIPLLPGPSPARVKLLDSFSEVWDRAGVSKLQFDANGLVSPGGVRYSFTPNSHYGEKDRLEHIMRHMVPDPSRAEHSVFEIPQGSTLVDVIDDAWGRKGNLILDNRGRGKYEVDLGYTIGRDADGKLTSRIRIAVDKSNNVITAFPIP